MIETPEIRICDVHRLLDFDVQPRECTYCPFCSAWICYSCQGNWFRRIEAAIRRRLEPGYDGQPDYPEQMKKQLEEQNGIIRNSAS